MDPAEYDYMFHLEDTLWWYVGMRRIAEKLLRSDLIHDSRRRQILDAGAGTGGSLALLEKFGEVTAFDFETRAAEMYKTRQQGRICVASIDAIPFADATFDLVTSFDVICQLPAPGDEAALREMWRVLKPGGGLMLRVPAFQFLHGPHDIVLHTQHRYSAGELATKLKKAGFEPLRATYSNVVLFPAALVRRLLSRLMTKGQPTESDVRPVPDVLNRALTAVLSTEASIVDRVNVPFGLSAVAVARKP